MKIKITLHAVERYMENRNLTDIGETNNLLRAKFVHLYQYGEINSVYNCKKEVTLENEKIVFSEKDWDYTLITYVALNKWTREYHKKIKQHKLKVKKARRNKIYNR